MYVSKAVNVVFIIKLPFSHSIVCASLWLVLISLLFRLMCVCQFSFHFLLIFPFFPFDVASLSLMAQSR